MERRRRVDAIALGDRGVPLGRRAPRRRDRGEPRAGADVRQLALRLGRADRRRPLGPRDRLLGRRRARRPVALPVPLRRRDRARRGARPPDPRRRRVGARAGRLLGSRPAARPARRGDPPLRPDERRARLGLADRRPPRRPLHRPPRAHRRPPFLDLHRRQHRGDVPHRVLARARVRHRPGPRCRRGRAARRGGVRRRRRGIWLPAAMLGAGAAAALLAVGALAPDTTGKA